MARNACLAIGISDAPPLDYLPGAVNGAKAIAEWARKSGYETKLLTDSEDPVRVSDVADALTSLLRRGAKTDRLIIYFAGHGLTQGVFEDLWLLSEWRQKQAAIGVGLMLRRLQRYGIGQLAVIADACRSLPTSQDTAELEVEGVLELGPYDPKQIWIDNLRASSKYKAAYMIPGANADDDRCIFSGVLEEVLWGQHPEAVDDTRAGDPKCITSVSLVKCLAEKVPAKAREYAVELTPELVPGFLRPDDIYVAVPVADAPAEKAWPPAGATAALGPGASAGSQGERGWSTKEAKSFTVPDGTIKYFGPEVFPGAVEGSGADEGEDGGGRMARINFGLERERDFEEGRRRPGRTLKKLAKEARTQIDAEAKRRSATAKRILDTYAEEQAPTHFETGAGFTVTGANVTDVVLGSHGVASYEPGPFGGWRVQSANEHYLAQPLPLLAKLDDGYWIGAAVMPGFITRLSVQHSNNGQQPPQSASLIFRTVQGWAPDTSDADAEKALAQVRAGAVDDEELRDLALKLRRDKHVDPILGVIAAYMYFSRGESIAQIAFYCATVGQPIPFDIALLAGLKTDRSDGSLIATVPATRERKPRTEAEKTHKWTFQATPQTKGKVAGAFPWLRQGWSLIDEADEGLVDPGLDEVASELVQGTFTTLTAAGGDALAKLLSK